MLTRFTIVAGTQTSFDARVDHSPGMVCRSGVNDGLERCWSLSDLITLTILIRRPSCWKGR